MNKSDYLPFVEWEVSGTRPATLKYSIMAHLTLGRRLHNAEIFPISVGSYDRGPKSSPVPNLYSHFLKKILKKSQ
jgi:hypothetical protein